MDKGSDQSSDFIRSRVQRKVAGVENVDFSLRHVLPIAFGFTGIERQIVRTPKRSA